MTRLKANSRAASTKEEGIERSEARVTEMINGQLISKPVKKVTLVEKQEQEPIVIDLQEQARESKAGSSVPNINKLKVIHDFIHGKH